MQALPPFKRVVTGHDARGRAVVASLGATANVFALQAVPGTVFHEIWNSSGSPALLDNADDPTSKPLQLSPGPQGSVIRVVDTEGEVWLVLDDEEVHLKRGDVVVQRGTHHAWSNRTEAMARMVFILLDGRFAAELPNCPGEKS